MKVGYVSLRGSVSRAYLDEASKSAEGIYYGEDKYDDEPLLARWSVEDDAWVEVEEGDHA